MDTLTLNINTRQKSIIRGIINSEGRITIGGLSEKTHLSVRIIRYNIKTVKQWFANEGVEMVSRSGFGIELMASKNERKHLLELLDNRDGGTVVLTPTQRQSLILLKILTSDNIISYHDLIYFEDMSKGTMTNDFRSAEKWLNQFNLFLNRIHGKEIQIIGTELARRIALVSLLINETEPLLFYKFWNTGNVNVFNNFNNTEEISKFLSNLPLQNSRNSISQIEIMVGQKFAIEYRIEALLFLAVSMGFLQSEKKGLDYPKINDNLDSELVMSRFIMTKLSRMMFLSKERLEAEVELFAVYLSFARWEWKENINDFYNSDINTEGSEISRRQGFLFSAESVESADSMIAACSAHIHPMLQTSQELLITLSRHLQPAINRLKYDLPIFSSILISSENLVECVKSEYPDIIKSVESDIHVIEEVIGKKVPMTLIATITMYIVSALNELQIPKNNYISVMILGSGAQTMTLFLTKRLKLLFPMFKVIDVYNGFPPDVSLLQKPDLVLSLLPHDPDYNNKVIEVSPFLYPNDIKTLQNWMLDFTEKNRLKTLHHSQQPDLVDLLLPEHILFRESAENWHKAVFYACEPLLNDKSIEVSYYEDILDMTSKYGPYMLLSANALLLHAAPTDGVNRLCLSVLILQKPVNFLEKVDIDIIFVLGTDTYNTHLNALFQLGNIMEDIRFIDALRKSTETTEVIRAFWNYLP